MTDPLFDKLDALTFVQTAQSIGIFIMAGALLWAVWELRRAIQHGQTTITRLFERQDDLSDHLCLRRLEAAEAVSASGVLSSVTSEPTRREGGADGSAPSGASGGDPPAPLGKAKPAYDRNAAHRDYMRRYMRRRRAKLCTFPKNGE